MAKGRKRLYAEADKPYRGAPILTIRLSPELFDWVHSMGGTPFVRSLIEAAHDDLLPHLTEGPAE